MSMPVGKIRPNTLRKIVFSKKGYNRDDVIIGPGIGTDSAIMKNSKNYIVATTDPITASTKLLGKLAIFIVTNDLIVGGALPKWYLSTILLPNNATENMLREITNDMDKYAKKLEMQIVGGHTEVTPYLNTPIVIGTAIGTTNKFYSSTQAKPNDFIIMTKKVGIEGIAIIAHEYTVELEENGFSKEEIIKLQKLIDETTIYPEGKILITRFKNYIHAMHDPTEGGVFTALHELADAANTGIEVYFEKISIDTETLEVCRVLGLNPYLLLSSGSLLITMDNNEAERMIKVLKRKRIEANIIGKLLKNPFERKLIKDRKRMKLPRQEKDEIWKLFEKSRK